MTNRKSGFTLIELMYVVGIMGLLATIGTYITRQAVKNGRITTARGELAVLAASTLRLAWDTGQWPNQNPRNAGGSQEVWDLSTQAAGLAGSDGSFNDWQGPYYRLHRLDPWGQPYFFDPDYSINGVAHPVVGSFGPNKKGRNLYDADDLYVRLDD